MPIRPFTVDLGAERVTRIPHNGGKFRGEHRRVVQIIDVYGSTQRAKNVGVSVDKFPHDSIRWYT